MKRFFIILVIILGAAISTKDCYANDTVSTTTSCCIDGQDNYRYLGTLRINAPYGAWYCIYTDGNYYYASMCYPEDLGNSNCEMHRIYKDNEGCYYNNRYNDKIYLYNYKTEKKVQDVAKEVDRS